MMEVRSVMSCADGLESERLVSDGNGETPPFLCAFAEHILVLKERHRQAEQQVSRFEGMTSAGFMELIERLQQFHERAMQAASMKHLPDAAFAAERATAERLAVRRVCDDAIRRLQDIASSAASAGSVELAAEMDVAINPLRKLLLEIAD